MSPEQLEKASKRFCEIMGIDPDQEVPDPMNDTMMWVVIPRWKAVTHEIKHAEALISSIHYGKGQNP